MAHRYNADVKKVESEIKDLKSNIEKLNNEISEPLKQISESMDMSVAILNELKNATVRHMNELKKAQKEVLDKSTAIMSGGYDKLLKGVGSGLELKLKPEEINAIRSTWYGKTMLHMLEMYKKTYVMFPALGYAGVRLFSRMVRSIEYFAKAHAMKQKIMNERLQRLNYNSKKSNEYLEKIRNKLSNNAQIQYMKRMVDNIKKQYRFFKGKHIYGTTKIGENPEFNAGLITRGIVVATKEGLKKSFFTYATKMPMAPPPTGGKIIGATMKGMNAIGGAITGMSMGIQGIFALVKVISYLFGDAVKPLMAVVKIFKMAFTMLLKPVFDMLMMILMPIAVFFMVLFANLYKWMMKGFLKKGFKAMVKFVHIAIQVANGISKVVGGIGSLGGKISNLFTGLGNWFGGLGKSIGNWFNGGINYWKGVLSKVWKFLKPVRDVMGWLISISKDWFGLIAGAIYGLFTGDFSKFFNSFDNLKKDIVGYFTSMGKLIYNVLKTIVIYYYNIFIKPFVNFFKPAFKPITNFVNDIWNKFKIVIDAIIALFHGDFKPILKIIIMSYNKLKELIWNKFKIILQPIKNVLDWLWGGIKSIVDYIKNLPSNLANALKGILGFQTGGYVMKTGLYKLHAGEAVVPRWNVKDGSSNTNNYYFNIEIHAGNNIDVDELVEEIQRKIRGVVSW